MRTVGASIEIAVPANDVWSLLAEFRWWSVWGPTVRAVSTSAEVVAPGVTGRVQTPLRFWVPFRITDTEPGRSWDWAVAGIRASGHRITELSPTLTHVEFTVPPWMALYVLVLRIGLRRLKRVAEST